MSKGLFERMKEQQNKNTVSYRNLNLEDIRKTVNHYLTTHNRRDNVLLTGSYGIAVFNNDKQLIAEFHRKFRIEDIGRIRKLITQYGKETARVFHWLNKKNTPTYRDFTWNLFPRNLHYKGIGSGEEDHVYLTVKYEHAGFYFYVRANECAGYCNDTYNDLLGIATAFDFEKTYNNILETLKYEF